MSVPPRSLTLFLLRIRVYFSVVMIAFRAYAKENPDKKYLFGYDGETLYDKLSKLYAFCVVGVPNLFCLACWFFSFSWVFGVVFFTPIAVGHVLYIWALLYSKCSLSTIRKQAETSRKWAEDHEETGRVGGGRYLWLKIPKFWQRYSKGKAEEIGEIDLYKLPFETLEDTLWWLDEDIQNKARDLRIQCESLPIRLILSGRS